MSAGPGTNKNLLSEKNSNSQGLQNLSSVFPENTRGGNLLNNTNNVIISIVISLIIVLLFLISRKNAQIVYLDGIEIGIINNTAISAEEVTSMLEEKLITEKHTNVQIKSEISLEPTRANNDDMVSEEDIVNQISNESQVKIEATSISIDGVVVGNLVDENQIHSILDDIKSKYIEEGIEYIAEPEFLENVSLEKIFISESDISNLDELTVLLNSNKNTPKIHVIESGDTLFGLAIENNISLKEILQANPQLTEDSILKLGSEVNLLVLDPFLSVVTYEEATFIEVIPKEIVSIENNSEYQTHYKVLTKGSDGSKEVLAEVTRINGSVSDRLIITERLIEEAVTEKIEIGTLQTPPKKSMGSFIYPLNGTLSSGYGTRWGRLHKGIDLAAGQNTPIKASDGGTVVYSGWYSGYGNMVKIDHGNGFQTLYAHNTRNVVDVGQKVAQGEVIAYVGSTGNSTGNHLHFEILLNGTAVNPMNYL